MNQLKRMQEQFCLALIEGTSDIKPFIASSDIDERLDIYRQNVLANLSNCLSIIYPGIWQLIGEQCANEVSHAFAQNISYLPKPGELDIWAGRFPAFLNTLTQLKDLPYLSDYAQLEWLQHLAYGTPNASFVSLDELEKIPEASLNSLKVTFISSTHFFDSTYPLEKIQDLLKNPDLPPITLNEGGSFCLITRIEDEIKVLWLKQDLWIFLNSLAHGSPLEKNVHLTQEAFPDFDLPQALVFMFQQQIVHKIHH